MNCQVMNEKKGKIDLCNDFFITSKFLDDKIYFDVVVVVVIVVVALDVLVWMLLLLLLLVVVDVAFYKLHS